MTKRIPIKQRTLAISKKAMKILPILSFYLFGTDKLSKVKGSFCLLLIFVQRIDKFFKQTFDKITYKIDVIAFKDPDI